MNQMNESQRNLGFISMLRMSSVYIPSQFSNRKITGWVNVRIRSSWEVITKTCMLKLISRKSDTDTVF